MTETVIACDFCQIPADIFGREYQIFVVKPFKSQIEQGSYTVTSNWRACSSCADAIEKFRGNAVGLANYVLDHYHRPFSAETRSIALRAYSKIYTDLYKHGLRKISSQSEYVAGQAQSLVLPLDSSARHKHQS